MVHAGRSHAPGTRAKHEPGRHRRCRAFAEFAGAGYFVVRRRSGARRRLCPRTKQLHELLRFAAARPAHVGRRDSAARPKEAIKELHRSRELGSKALNVKATPIPGKEWWDPNFDPIFKELQDLKMPIIF